MKLQSLEKPLYFPHIGKSTVMHLGLQPLDPKQWMHPDLDFDTFEQHKLDQLKRFGEKVYVTLPESKEAQAEFHQLLLEHLLSDHKDYYHSDESHLYFSSSHRWNLGDNTLWNDSLWAQEDICLLEPDSKGYRLTAASVCSPSNWKLEDKIGRSLDDIHGPIPDYNKQLALQVNRFFDRIKVNRPVWRLNWSIQPHNHLDWREEYNSTITSETELFWRVERQTLRRLPKTGAVIFTIRVYLHSFNLLIETPGFIDGIQNNLKCLPETLLNYKGLNLIKVPFEKYVAARTTASKKV